MVDTAEQKSFDEKDSLLEVEKLPRFDELLPTLSNGEIQVLYEHLEEQCLDDGEVLFRQGGEGETLYIIKSGSVSIVLENKDGSRSRLTTLNEGHIIGEIAFLMRSIHSATAEAEGAAELYLLHKHHFDAIVLEDPTLAFKIVQGINLVLCYRLGRMNKELTGVLRGGPPKHERPV